MSMNDPIADYLTRIRNALRARHDDVVIPRSGVKEQLSTLLQKEGYIDSFTVAGEGAEATIRVKLRYTPSGEGVIRGIRRVSRPSLRVYVKSKEMKPVRSGLGISVVSTSRGMMTGKTARDTHVGGEVLCEVW